MFPDDVTLHMVSVHRYLMRSHCILNALQVNLDFLEDQEANVGSQSHSPTPRPIRVALYEGLVRSPPVSTSNTEVLEMPPEGGLDVVRRIITVRCNGQVGFPSHPGQTVFWVHLPMSVDQVT